MPKQKFGQVGTYWLTKVPGSDNWYRTWCENRRTRRASIGTDDPELAFQALVEWVAAHGRRRHEEPEDVSFEGVLYRYWEQYGKELASRDTVNAAMGYWSDLIPESYVSDLTIEVQETFIKDLRALGKSDGYIKRILGVGRAALNRAHKRHELRSVPYIIELEDGEAAERIFSLNESAALFTHCESDHLFMYLMVAFNTAGRPEAIKQLKRFQVDLEHRLIEFNAPGRKQTRKRRPVVPITDTLLPWLENLTTANVVSYGKKDREIGSIRTAWAKLLEDAGLEPGIRPQAIRHTMATWMRMQGVQEWEVAGMLGHRAGRATTERYAKYAPDYLGKARKAIDGYFLKLQKQVDRTLILSPAIKLRASVTRRSKTKPT